ncbi:BTAD domain-containing putative transcriptional regulator [Actinoplanes sp. NPDC051411]|uniref:AfsR/SARP family transcriptional regulator n=1 Tax=Actinoplanes sp. NPDC051411 TaxID=3155522 RepID=UPI00343293DE
MVPVEYRILGPLRVSVAGLEADPGPRQLQLILALLLVRCGEPVSTGELVELLWPGCPPATARNVVHRHIGALRRLLQPELANRAPGRWVVRAGDGYRLNADEETLDLLRFRALARDAADARAHDPAAAAGRYAAALTLWRDWSAKGLESVSRLNPEFVSVDNELVGVALEAADLALRTGQWTVLLPQLRRAADRDPLDEGLQSRVLLCLAAAGRTAEALTRYRRVRDHLRDDLDVGPGPELVAAYRALRNPAAIATAAPPPPPRTAPRPAQLPPDLPPFTGRADELAALDRAAQGRTAMVAVAIDGMPGVGKSALALHWAHRRRDQFPDGQLYFNLRGFDEPGTMIPATEVLRQLLNALGVTDEQMPVGCPARAGLYRTLLQDRRLLVILDNVRSTAHVADLLPGSPGCMVLITSRRPLDGLAAQGARQIGLGLLGPGESRLYLTNRIGAVRANAEPAALAEIVRHCAGLPLALAVVSARITENPTFSLDSVAGELRSRRTSLEGFCPTDDRTDLRAVFSWSYEVIPPAAQRVFRLLSLHPDAEFPVAAAATAAQLPAHAAGRLCRELVGQRMLLEPSPARFAYHELMRAYALELATGEESEADRRDTAQRLSGLAA